MKKRILILCTGNSCRSQMAEGFLKSFDSELIVYSAGTSPALVVNPKAVEVMKEIGIDISSNTPEDVQQYLAMEFDYVITVCGNAKETCPVFVGKVLHRLHIGFDDPAEAEGSDEEVMSLFRRVRDEIREGFFQFYTEAKKGEPGLDIKVLGPGCVNCVKLAELTKEVLEETGISGNIEKITDRERFADFGVMLTPALVVNGKLLVSGKIPTKSTLINWLNAEINRAQ